MSDELSILAKLDSICDRFEENWTAESRPDFDGLLNQVDSQHQNRLLKLLLEVDVELRKKAGQSVLAAEYREFGSHIVAHVNSVLSDGSPSFSPANDNQTRNHAGAVSDNDETIAPPRGDSRAGASPVVGLTDERSGKTVSGPINNQGPCPITSSDETLSFIVVRKDGTVSVADQHPSGQQTTAYDTLDDRYQLFSQLGEGGMGTVMLGQDVRLDRKVAVKLIRDDHWNSSNREFMESEFDSEVRVAASLVNPAIAGIYDYGFHNSIPYAVFEYVGGESLKDCISRKGAYGIDDVRDVIGQLALALDYAHEKGIVHRDLKPDNVRFDEFGQPKILDFGLAKNFRMHNDWRFAGTPAYSSPEQASEKPSDGRTDQYALALIAFEMLSGKRPFEANSWQEMLAAHRESELVWPPDGGNPIPEPPKKAIERALSKLPGQRFQSCCEFAVAFGCQIQTRSAAGSHFDREAAAELPREGIFQNHAYLGLLGHELWICSRERIVVVDVRGLSSATAEIRSMKGPGILGRDIFGSGGPRFQKTIILKEHREEKWWKRFNSQLPPGSESLTMRTKEIAREWSNELEGIKQRDSKSFGKECVVARVIFPPALVAGAPDGRMQILGPCATTADSKGLAELKLMLQAASIGADAIIKFRVEKLVTAVGTRWNANGIATRSLDGTTREEFGLRKYGRQCRLLGLTVIVFAIATLALRLGILGLLTPRLADATVWGMSLNLALILYSSPIFVGAFAVMMTKWPQLLRPLALYTFAWAWISAPVMLGVMIAEWNDVLSDELFSEVASWGRRIRKLEGLVAATGIALAIKLYAIGGTSAVNDKRKLPTRRIAIGYFAWILTISAVVLLVLMLGWQLKIHP